MRLADSDFLLFQGDSITDTGRRESSDGLGAGYVPIIKGLLYSKPKGPRPRVENRGVGGDRTAELLVRWKEDCEDLRPTVLSLMIGVNDVWRIREVWNGQTYVEPGQYRENLNILLDHALGAGVRKLILMSPTTIANETDKEFSTLLDERTEIVKSIAREYSAIYVPTREDQKRLLRERPDTAWTIDGCHPTTTGHAAIARCWLKATGLA
jgi:acyl-CoA thioesterase I